MEGGRQLLKRKQDIIAAVKAGNAKEALGLLQQGLADITAGDAVLTELLSVLQQKVAQDEEAAADDTASSDTDDSDSSGSSSGSTDSESEGSADADFNDCADDGGHEEEQERAAVPAVPASLPHQQPSSTHPTLGLAEQAHEGTADDEPVTDKSTSPAAAVAAAGATAAVCGIKLDVSSCSLSRGQRARLRQQLAAGLEQQKQAAVLERALANDPLLSMSLTAAH